MIDLFDVATKFRAAIEEAIRVEDFSAPSEINMLSFPRGCCTYASDMLQRFLYDQGIMTFYTSGRFSYGWEAESHAWLETSDGIVIDITGINTVINSPQFDTPKKYMLAQEIPSTTYSF